MTRAGHHGRRLLGLLGAGTRSVAAALSLIVAAAMALGAVPVGALSTQQQGFLQLAERGVARAQVSWRDRTQSLFVAGKNRPISWYDERLHYRPKYPLATIWGAVPLFESLSAVALADPTPANRAALAMFAQGPAPPRCQKRRKHAACPPNFRRGAEAYWDPSVRPAPGYAPYPGDRGNPNTWCDDNAWWGLAFLDAYRALRNARYLADAQRAFDFIVRACWDRAAGGTWWNTYHTPQGQKSGEPLAAGSLLGALLAKAYRGQALLASGARAASSSSQTASSDLQNVETFLAWGDAHFADANGLYWRTGDDPTPTPYVAGAAVEAKELLCQMVGEAYCGQASQLADAAAQRFADRLNMGPQFDTIYLHWMLAYGTQTNDTRWTALALEMANNALANSGDPSTGLYLKAWDGSDMSGHQADTNMLRTHAATVELLAWLATN